MPTRLRFPVRLAAPPAPAGDGASLPVSPDATATAVAAGDGREGAEGGLWFRLTLHRKASRHGCELNALGAQQTQGSENDAYHK